MDSNKTFTDKKDALLYAVYSGYWLFQLEKNDPNWCAGKSNELYTLYTKYHKENDGTYSYTYWWWSYINKTEEVSQEIQHEVHNSRTSS